MSMSSEMYDLIVIGGGPAGSAAAITAARLGAHVVLLERGRFPRHKVCGEFVSQESLGILRRLLQPDSLLVDQAPRVGRARFFVDGKVLRAPVSPPAASISRFELDDSLWRAAERAGADCRQQTNALHLSGSGPFTVATQNGHFQSSSVIDCTGRWSNFKSRNGDSRSEKWIGLKAHFFEPNPSATVDLYFFEGGYCGVQPVKSLRSRGSINACAIVRPHLARTLNELFVLERRLRQRSRNWEQTTELVTTWPLSFHDPSPLRGRVLLAGDAAGFIDPFAGDGISLALRSGVLAAETLAPFWRKEMSLELACNRYESHYRNRFLPLFRNSRRVRRLLSIPVHLRSPLVGLAQHTSLPEFLIRTTRGA